MPEGRMEMKIGIIGVGKMGSALAKGLMRSGEFRILAYDKDESARKRASELGIELCRDNHSLAEMSDVIILAAKPGDIPGILEEIRGLAESKLVISIAAGIRTSLIEGILGEGKRVVRVMPNIGCLVLSSASAISPGRWATESDMDVAERIFGSIGISMRVEEALMDAVTGLSGSGPAFIAMVIDALADGGVKMGLPRDLALRLSAQTALATAKMILDLGRSPSQIKEEVSSPGGTTMAGIYELEKGGLRAALIGAVEAATRRSSELSGGRSG
jgi:pyrroline-5-carboxylate reductase